MATQLIAYATHAFGRPPQPSAIPEVRNENALRKIFVLLRAQTRHDFSQYKPSTNPTPLKWAEACLQVRTARSPQLLSALSKKSLSPEETQRTLHELMVQQIELELQNDELRETQSALTESLDRFTEFYDSAPVGYTTLDAEGTVLVANLTLATMLNTARGRIVGLPFNRFVAFNSQDSL